MAVATARVKVQVRWRRRWLIRLSAAAHELGWERLSRRLLDGVLFDVYAGDRRISTGRLSDYLA